MKAEEYLELWLGDNMNTETLKWKAIAEFAEDYHKSRLKEIMLTDEEIVNSFEYCNPIFIEGAKWMRDKLKTK